MGATINLGARTMNSSPAFYAWNKVPQVTLAFWVIKLLSTTVGETVADSLAVDLGLGTLVTGAGMGLLLIASLGVQLRQKRCVPAVYWLTVVLISIVGTQITDALTDALGVSLYVSTTVFAIGLALLLGWWHREEGTLSIAEINTPKRELYYWGTILLTFALGTAAGDLATEALGLGFRWGVVSFTAAIGVVMFAWYLGANAVACFWVAYILTRPLGAALGDLLSQSTEYGGVGLGAATTSGIFLGVIVILVTIEQLRRVPASNFASPAAR